MHIPIRKLFFAGYLALLGGMMTGGSAVASTTEHFQANINDESLTSISCAALVCTLVTDGSGTASELGQVTDRSVITLDFGAGPPCAAASVVETLSSGSGTIALLETGSDCRPGATAGTPATVDIASGTWNVGSSSGALAGASGSGKFTVHTGGPSSVTSLSGTLALP